MTPTVDPDLLTEDERARRGQLTGAVKAHSPRDLEAVVLDAAGDVVDWCPHRHRSWQAAARCARRGVAAWHRYWWPDWASPGPDIC